MRIKDKKSNIELVGINRSNLVWLAFGIVFLQKKRARSTFMIWIPFSLSLSLSIFFFFGFLCLFISFTFNFFFGVSDKPLRIGEETALNLYRNLSTPESFQLNNFIS